MTQHSKLKKKLDIKYGLLGFTKTYLRWTSFNRSPRPLSALELHPEETMRLYSSYVFCIAGVVFMLSFLSVALYMNNEGALLPMGGLLLLCILSCVYISQTNKATLPVLLIITYLYVMCAYLLWIGVTDSNTILYYLLVPPIMIGCLNIRLSTTLSFIFIVMIVVLFLPPVYEHTAIELSAGYRFRLALALVSICIITIMSEYYINYTFRSIFNLNRQLEKYSLTDALTGLGNRRNFINQFQRLHATQLRSNEPFTLIMVDMDHFKKINDTYGHLLGDEVLCFVANILGQSLRQQDSLYRWGGEEFIVLLPDAGTEQGVLVAERMRGAIEAAPFVHGSLSINLTASFGVHTVSTAEPLQEQVKHTDLLLYEAKASGRNRVVSTLDLLNASRKTDSLNDLDLPEPLA